jgi:uncharacterized protein YutE (UPF0331/DUF86 family)
VTFLVERLAELRKHLDHLRALRPLVTDAAALARDLSLHNDVLFSLGRVAQLVIDAAGEIASRRGIRFGSYREAVGSLAEMEEFSPELVERLVRLPGFRNVLVHDYLQFDLQRAVEALDELEPVEHFLRTAATLVEREEHQ